MWGIFLGKTFWVSFMQIKQMQLSLPRHISTQNNINFGIAITSKHNQTEKKWSFDSIRLQFDYDDERAPPAMGRAKFDTPQIVSSHTGRREHRKSSSPCSPSWEGGLMWVSSMNVCVCGWLRSTCGDNGCFSK